MNNPLRYTLKKTGHMHMERIIEINNLTKYYGKTRGIEDLNLKIHKGEIFGFLGPNGAGKSTTIRLILNLLKPDSGNIKIFDKEVKKNYHHIFKHIGNVPGELTLYEELTGAYFLNYIASFSGNPPYLREKLTEAFQLSKDILAKKIKYYSRGMKQKLGIIQAMQEEPDLLIMDEPSEGLDPLNKNVLYDFLKRFKKKDKTIFFSSHNLTEVDKICDSVGLVRNGKLIAEESILNLKKKMVRRMEIQFKDNINADKFKNRSITIKEYKNKHLVLYVTGSIDWLIKKISEYEIQNIIFPESTLEDTFMTYYQ
jgi:ABC-2 type transport system ATP-binding protein